MMQVDRVAALWFGAMELKLRAPSEVIIIIYGSWASSVSCVAAWWASQRWEKTVGYFLARSAFTCVHVKRNAIE